MSWHTPGPWTQGSGKQADCVWIDGHHEMGVGMGDAATWIDCNTPANARLIAAAPELLEALTVAREWMRGDKWRNSTVEKHASWEAVMRGIDAAIAKAMGEQP